MNSSFAYPPDELLLLLGKLISIWSHVESRFDLLFISEIAMSGRSTGKIQEIRQSKIGSSIMERIGLIREAARSGKLKRSLSWEDMEPTLSRFVNAKKERDKYVHGQLTATWSGADISRAEAARIYKSWKSNKEFEVKTISEKDLVRLIDLLETLYWEFFDLDFGQKPGSMNSVSASHIRSSTAKSKG
jgi:hypothetical protein